MRGLVPPTQTEQGVAKDRAFRAAGVLDLPAYEWLSPTGMDDLRTCVDCTAVSLQDENWCCPSCGSCKEVEEEDSIVAQPNSESNAAIRRFYRQASDNFHAAVQDGLMEVASTASIAEIAEDFADSVLSMNSAGLTDAWFEEWVNSPRLRKSTLSILRLKL